MNADLTTAVFEVEAVNGTMLAYAVYVRLENGLSRGAAIPQIKNMLEERKDIEVAKFKFWADGGITSIGTSPMRLS